MMHKSNNKDTSHQKLDHLLSELKQILLEFENKFGVADIISNSKIYEVLIAESLHHDLIPGHSGSRDGKDDKGEYEYKHFKELSSNHSWTFNDYSDSTIEKLRNVEAVIFAHIDDTKYPPVFDWYYKIPGNKISNYLTLSTRTIRNIRKMINVSPLQIENRLKIRRSKSTRKPYVYNLFLIDIFAVSKEIENLTGTKNILTSNKLWEVLVASKLGHKVLSQQGGRLGAHDAVDDNNNYYEYKVSKSSFSWNFQDISDRVLEKYTQAKGIVLAVVNKKNLEVDHIYIANPEKVINRLKEKLADKKRRYQSKGGLRRLQVSLSKGDLDTISALHIYKS